MNEILDDKYRFDIQDAKRIGKLAGIEVEEFGPETKLSEIEERYYIPDPENVSKLLKEMGLIALTSDGDKFSDYVYENMKRIRALASTNYEVKEMLILGYRMGISRGSGLCMNNLGALYYRGDIVEQDYEEAAKLYEMAMECGCYQSIINLGYIYEYGRIGKPDHNKAYMYYSLAATLSQNSEAVYKLGDMFSRGQAAPRDIAKAYMLWEKSLDLATNEVEYAQGAIRIAKLLIDPKSEKWGIEMNPLRALALYQRAEIGLRIDIDNGMTYYKKRLEEAIEGQKKARELIENPYIEI